MPCSSAIVKDFLNIHGRSSNSSSDKDDSSVAANKDNELYVGGSSLQLRKGMFQTMDLFQKNIFSANNNDSHSEASIRKTLMMMKDLHRRQSGGAGVGAGGGDGVGIRRIPSIPLRSPEYFGGSRPPSLLERSLLPGTKRDLRLPIPSIGEQTETAQLTIFYAGMINVYDNVPVDKAQAIMLLANQCSASVSPPPLAENVTKVDVAKPAILGSHPPSLLNAPKDLPIARKHSLRRFLEKRRGRIINNFPYASRNDR